MPRARAQQAGVGVASRPVTRLGEVGSSVLFYFLERGYGAESHVVGGSMDVDRTRATVQGLKSRDTSGEEPGVSRGVLLGDELTHGGRVQGITSTFRAGTSSTAVSVPAASLRRGP